ncbi:hypothetical protein VTO42DRAFT_3898 [Malbranchea cinnamomea]
MWRSILASSLALAAGSAVAQQNQAVLSDNARTPSEDTADPLDSIISASPLLSLHRSLCEIKGISDHEQPVADFLTSYLTQRNFTVVKQFVPFDNDNDGRGDEPPRYNVYAYPSWQPPFPEIILTSHLDTVPPFIPYSLSAPNSSSSSREDILISGRGTVDAKASVAAQILAAETHLSSSPDTRLGLLFVVSEEVGGLGMSHFSQSDLNIPYPSQDDDGKIRGYHTVIFGEPTERTLAAGHKGSIAFTLSVLGKPAHSGYPWLGRSAVSRILPILERIDNLGRISEAEGGLPHSDKYGNTTVNIGIVRAGVANNVVPASAFADITARLAGGTVDDAKRAIRKAVFGESDDDDRDVELVFGGDPYAPVDLDTDVDGFEIDTMNYGTDVPHLDVSVGHDHGETDVKRYLYGPGSILVAHGKNEALTVGELEAGYEGYLKLIDAAVKRGEKLRRGPD